MNQWRTFTCWMWLLCIVGIFFTPTPVFAIDIPQEEIYQHTKSSTALIVAVDDNAGSVSFGSGVFINRNGLILTNAHVIEGYKKLFVYVRNQLVFPSPTVVAVDEDLDLAALHVPAVNVRPLTLAAELPAEGTPAIAAGYPRIFDILQMGLTLHTSVFPIHVSGIASGRSRTKDRPTIFIQTTGMLNSGISGGPLVQSDNGELIGMVVHTVPYFGQAKDGKGAVVGSVMMQAGISYSIPAPLIRQWLHRQKLTYQKTPMRQPPGTFEASLGSTGDGPKGQALTFFSTAHLLHTIANAINQDADLLQSSVHFYKLALQLQPQSPWISRSVGRAYAALGRWKEAAHSYRIALAADPGDADLLADAGDSWYHLKNLGQAIRHYQGAIKLNPCSAQAHNGFGRILWESGRKTHAFKEFGLAFGCQPSSPIIVYNWGLALEDRGAQKDALRVWEEFLKRPNTQPSSERSLINKIKKKVDHLRSIARIRPTKASPTLGVK